jgi:poly(ADP-ribose) glycohydrolase
LLTFNLKGRVQEEILFVIKPECLVSMLICAKMDDNEAIIIRGAERFSEYSGYGLSFEWRDDHQDKTEWLP